MSANGLILAEEPAEPLEKHRVTQCSDEEDINFAVDVPESVREEKALEESREEAQKELLERAKCAQEAEERLQYLKKLKADAPNISYEQLASQMNEKFNDKFTPVACYNALITSDDPRFKKGHWEKEETKTLREAIAGGKNDIKELEKLLPGRSRLEIRRRMQMIIECGGGAEDDA